MRAPHRVLLGLHQLHIVLVLGVQRMQMLHQRLPLLLLMVLKALFACMHQLPELRHRRRFALLHQRLLLLLQLAQKALIACLRLLLERLPLRAFAHELALASSPTLTHALTLARGRALALLRTRALWLALAQLHVCGFILSLTFAHEFARAPSPALAYLFTLAHVRALALSLTLAFIRTRPFVLVYACAYVF